MNQSANQTTESFEIPLTFSPFLADGSKPQELQEAFLRSFMCSYEQILASTLSFNGVSYRLIIEAGTQRRLEKMSPKHFPAPCLISFQDWGTERRAVLRIKKEYLASIGMK